MTEGLEDVAAAATLYRLGRAPDPWAWPDWSHSLPDGTLATATTTLTAATASS